MHIKKSSLLIRIAYGDLPDVTCGVVGYGIPTAPPDQIGLCELSYRLIIGGIRAINHYLLLAPILFASHALIGINCRTQKNLPLPCIRGRRLLPIYLMPIIASILFFAIHKDWVDPQDILISSVTQFHSQIGRLIAIYGIILILSAIVITLALSFLGYVEVHWRNIQFAKRIRIKRIVCPTITITD